MSPTPVIIDTDPGVDDIVALLLALASPELEILAIIVSFGNTDIDSSRINVLKTYQAIRQHIDAFPEDAARFPNFNGSKKPILALGSAGPLEGELHSAQYFHGRDGLGGISERHPELDLNSFVADASVHPQLELSTRSGTDVILDIVASSAPQSVSYIALGPLTNLALAMRANGGMIRDRIGRIVCMGGCLDVAGNTSPVAEFNFFADPFAVKELLFSSREMSLRLPLDRFILLPLDITTPHELPFPIYKERVDPSFESPSFPSDSNVKAPLTHFTSSFLEKTQVIMNSFGKNAMELHDIVTVWCAIENPPNHPLASQWKTNIRHFDIERTGELTRGMLVVDRRDDSASYLSGDTRNREEVEKRQPEPIQIESESQVNGPPATGIQCVVNTPGPDVLLALLLNCVWGV